MSVDLMPPCPEYETFPPIIKSPLDPLEYRAIKLKNGLKALLISTIYGSEPPQPRKDLCVRLQVENFNATHLGIGQIADPPPPRNVLRPLARQPASSHIGGGLYRVFFTIGSGMLSDSYAGMAHFVEHLVFFGSKRYPEHEGFTKFLKRFGGDSNATTNLEFTCYEFSVTFEGLEEALDRFNDLIMNPLWKEGVVGNERNAITSEFWTLWMDDKFRYQGILQHLANPQHPLARLGLGHGVSLNVKDLTEHAKHWKDHHYVSNNISVVMISPASLDTMGHQIATHFSTLPTSQPGRDSPRTELRDRFINTPAMNQDAWNQSYYLLPSRHNNSIYISWLLLPGFGQNFKTKPLNILSFILIGRSEGGLWDTLRKRGWLISICPQCHSVDHTILNTIFVITLTLTQEGILHAEEVIREVFLYIQRLQSASSKELRRLFEQLRLSQSDSFHYRSDHHVASSHFLEELDPASIGDSDSSVRLFKMFTKFLLTQEEASIPSLLLDIFVSHKWDEALLRETMMLLLDPGIANVLIARKEGLLLPEVTEDMPWNGIWYFPTPTNFLTEYNIYGGWSIWKNLWGRRAHTWGSAGSRKYSLPPENRFTRSTQCFPISKSKSPSRFTILNNDHFLVRGYPEYCRRGYLSTAMYVFKVKSDIGLSSLEVGTYPQMTLLGKCWEALLYQKLAEALDTVITVSVSGVCDKLRAIVTGPAATLPNIFVYVVEAFDELEMSISPLLFSVGIQEILGILEENKSYSEFHLDRLVHNLLDKHVCSKRNFVEVFQDLTYTAFIRFIKKFKSEMKLSVELSGCVNKGDGHRVARSLQKLVFCPRNPARRPCGKNFRLQLPSLGKEWRFRKPGFNPLDPTHWVKNYYQLGANFDDIEPLNFIVEDLSEQVYHSLRGDKHIGYVADATLNESHSAYSLEIRVNALAYRFNTDWVEQEIDTFLTRYYHKFLCDKKYFLESIAKNGDDSMWTQVKRVYQQYLLPSGRQYKKLSIHILGAVGGVPCALRWNEPKVRKSGSNSPILIEDPIAFKKGLLPFPNDKRNDDNSEEEDNSDDE